MSRESNKQKSGAGFPLFASVICAVLGFYIWYEIPILFNKDPESAAIVGGTSVFFWFIALVFFVSAVLTIESNAPPPTDKKDSH